MSGDVAPPADDPIGERDARFPAAELAHLEARGRLGADVEAAAVAFGRDEHSVRARLDRLGEIAIELDRRASVPEPRRAEVLEPVLGAFHAMENALGAVRKRYHAVLHGCGQSADDINVAVE